MILSIIVAMNANRIIGDKGDLPWHLPSDLKRFRQLTIGHPVIMGRKTFESIIARNGQPLSDRQNIVVTRTPAPWSIKKESGEALLRNCVFVQTLQEATAHVPRDTEAFVIGGAEIYAQALPVTHKMYFTQVSGKFIGDTTFPRFNMLEWETIHDELVTTDNHPYAFSIMERIPNPALSAGVIGADLVNPTNTKSDAYGLTIKDIIKSGVCPFCPETFLWHPWPILHRIGDWFITRCGWPYAHARHHFMIIGDRHITADIDMTNRDDVCVKNLVRWAVHRFDLKGYGRTSRSGDTDHTGATVQHLHFHLIGPEIGENGKAVPVWFPIG